jgi:hypothetical protein
MSGSYALVVTDDQGCASTSDCIPIVVTATRDDGQASQLVLYPNPSSGRFHVSAPPDFTILKVRVTTFSGQDVPTGPATGGRVLDLSGQKPGVYLIHVITPEGRVVRKVIVNEMP